MLPTWLHLYSLLPCDTLRNKSTYTCDATHSYRNVSSERRTTTTQWMCVIDICANSRIVPRKSLRFSESLQTIYKTTSLAALRYWNRQIPKSVEGRCNGVTRAALNLREPCSYSGARPGCQPYDGSFSNARQFTTLTHHLRLPFYLRS